MSITNTHIFLLYRSRKHDWTSFHLLVLRTTWDYMEKTDLFTSWLDQVQQLNRVLVNPPNTVRWNINKVITYFFLGLSHLIVFQIYLKQLRDEFGVHIVPTVFLSKITPSISLQQILTENKWQSIGDTLA